MALSSRFAQAAETGTALGMFEFVPVAHIQDCLFEKLAESVAFIVGEEGQCICAVSRPNYVIVPVSQWIDADGVRDDYENAVPFRARVALECAAAHLTGDGIFPAHDQTVSEMGGNDRYFTTTRDEPILAPGVTLVSRGPAGYILNDTRHPDRWGVVVLTDRLRVLQPG
jgi:hypothetical protein